MISKARSYWLKDNNQARVHKLAHATLPIQPLPSKKKGSTKQVSSKKSSPQSQHQPTIIQTSPKSEKSLKVGDDKSPEKHESGGQAGKLSQVS